jgi:hypothetical protein
MLAQSALGEMVGRVFVFLAVLAVLAVLAIPSVPSVLSVPIQLHVVTRYGSLPQLEL